MSTAISYHSSRSKASSRLEGVKTNLDRSSSYMYGGSAASRTSAYDSLRRESSFTADSGRVGRTRTRDHSADFSAKPRRSSSLELSAPFKVRMRDRSTDFSINQIDRLSARPKTTMFDSKYEAKEYKDLTSSPDKYLTMQKYRDYDKTKEMGSLVEEERRSKAYAKIINSSSIYSQEQDASRACMSDIFMNTGGFSTKTVNAIAKEVYKEERGPKNYSWRKDMESYEENLEVLTAHKRVVQDSTRASRDVNYRSTDSKIRDYERESRKTVDSVNLDLTPTRRTDTSYSTNTNQSSYSNGSSTSNGYTKPEYSYSRTPAAPEPEYSVTATKKGSWRKNLEKYESDLELKKVQAENQRKIESYSEPTKSFQTKPTSAEVKPAAKLESGAKPTYSWKKAQEESTPETQTYSWQKPKSSEPSSVKTIGSSLSSSTAESVKSGTTTSKLETHPKTEVKSLESTPPSTTTYASEKEGNKPELKKPETIKKEEAKVEETKPTPTWKKTTATKTEEPQPETPKPTPKWKKPETTKKVEENAETKVEEKKPTPKWKKPSAAAQQTTAATPEVKPDWKAPETTKKEEHKEEEAKPTPKWKKPESAKKEEVKVEDPKPVPKWKKIEPVKKEEPQPEPPKEKVVPKWKKTETIKKEEPKVEETKPTPTWKKTTATKTEEPKPETPKPTPKWKKPEPTKKVEEKVEVKVEEKKPTPKWKKSEPIKKEEPKVEEPKSTPKWKKTVPPKKEDPKPEEPKPVPKWKKPAAVVKPTEVVEEPKPVPKWKKPTETKKEEPIKVEEPKQELPPKVEEAPEPAKPVIENKEEPEIMDKEEKKEAAVEENVEEKKEEEEEEDTTGMRAMRKETDNKFTDLDAEMTAGRSKLAALRAKMKALREKSKAQSALDAAADSARQG